MERPRCETCPFWSLWDDDRSEEVSAQEYRKRYGENADLVGGCYRFPPHGDRRVFDAKIPERQPSSVLKIQESRPEVWDFDWCGEHPDFPAYIASLKKDPA